MPDSGWIEGLEMRSAMKPNLRFAILMSAALVLGGCTAASSMLDSKSRVPQASQVNVGNPLAMPPDLSLAAPGQTSDAYQANPGSGETAQEAGLSSPPAAQKASTAPVTPLAPRKDIFDQYGISKIKDDGSAKTPDELKLELKAAILAKKRLTNPNYGTIRNIGAIFSDQ